MTFRPLRGTSRSPGLFTARKMFPRISHLFPAKLQRHVAQQNIQKLPGVLRKISPVCVFMCSSKYCFILKSFPHHWHMNCLCPMWMLMWERSWYLYWKRSLQFWNDTQRTNFFTEITLITGKREKNAVLSDPGMIGNGTLPCDGFNSNLSREKRSSCETHCDTRQQ